MKTLLILRHGKSSWKNDDLSDHERPHKKRGKRDAPKMRKLIREEGLIPDIILSSTARRAKDTTLLAIEAMDYNDEIQFRRDLYHTWSGDIIEILQRLGPSIQVAMVVGHNPGLEELLDSLAGAEEWLPTAALAHLELPISSWDQLEEDIDGKLVNLWRPRELD